MSMITVGGWGAGASRWPLPPRSPTSSSWTTLTTCWAGVSDLRTSWPTAFSRTRSTKARTTLKLTSASRRATRTSRRASWMFSSVRRPRAPNTPDRFLSETYGTVIQYIPVPPQQVVIQVPVPLPAGAPAQAQEPPGVPAQSRGEERSAPAQTQEQTVEIPGYYVAETTTGYWYPERWTLQQQNGVYQWVKLPAEFRKK